MRKFHATKYDEKTIELESVEELDELYKIIESSENFILMWLEGNVKMSKLILASDLVGKVRGGDITLTAKEGKKEVSKK